MTDFLSDSYGRRCTKEYRKLVKFLSENELNSSLHSQVPYIQFQLCLTKPLMENAPSWRALRKQMQECFSRNQSSIDKEDYSPCMHVLELIDQRGKMDVQSMLSDEPYQSAQVPQVLAAYRKEISNNGNENFHKYLNCLAFPEHTKCSDLRANVFSSIANSACQELFAISTKCFEKASKMEERSPWKNMVSSEDAVSRNSYKTHCDNVQRDMVNCAEKYFRLGIIAYENEKHMEMIDPDFRRKIKYQRWGMVTVEERLEQEQKIRNEQQRIDQLYRKYKQQQEEKK